VPKPEVVAELAADTQLGAVVDVIGKPREALK